MRPRHAMAPATRDHTVCRRAGRVLVLLAVFAAGRGGSAHASQVPSAAENPFPCAVDAADSAYVLAQKQPRASGSLDGMVDRVGTCTEPVADTPLVREAAGTLERLATNLGRLAGTVAAADRPMEGLAPSSGNVRYPIADAAVAGTIQQLLPVRVEDLHHEYMTIRAELEAFSARWPRRFAAVGSGYSGNVFGVGPVYRRGGGSTLLMAATVLYDSPNGAWGGELAAGIQMGDVALLPGIVFLPDSGGDAWGLSGTAILVRTGSLSLGFSASTLQGAGFKVVFGL